MNRIISTSAVFTLALLAALHGWAAAEDGAAPAQELAGKTILMVIAHDNFRDEELFTPKKAFEAKGATVKVASTDTAEASGMKGGKVTPDLLLKDAKAGDYAAVAFVGGSGAESLFDNADAHKLALDAAASCRAAAAICLGPVILAKAGALKGKQATVWDDKKHTYSKILTDNGATYKKQEVVEDGGIITANGPAAAAKFAAAVIKRLAAAL